MIRKTCLLLCLPLLLGTAALAQTPVEGAWDTYAQFKTWPEKTQLVFVSYLMEGINAAFDQVGERWPEDMPANLKGCTMRAPFVRHMLLTVADDNKLDDRPARDLIFRIYVMACAHEKEKARKR